MKSTDGLGRNQCVLSDAVAGSQLIRNGSRNGIPDMRNVLDDAYEWREMECLSAKGDTTSIDHGRPGDVASEILGLARDVLSDARDRDFRSFAVFSKEVVAAETSRVRAYDVRRAIRGGCARIVNFLATDSRTSDDWSVVDLQAPRRHMSG